MCRVRLYADCCCERAWQRTAHPWLQLLDKKLDRLLDQKAQVEAVRQAIPEDRQEAILQKRLVSMKATLSRDATE